MCLLVSQSNTRSITTDVRLACSASWVSVLCVTMAQTAISPSEWDPKFSLFFMQKLVQSRYLLREDTAADAFDHLRNHATLFIQQAVITQKSELNPTEEDNLEQLWARLLWYHEQKRWTTCLLTSPNDMVALKVLSVLAFE